jgi:YD repeat-containing protein
VVPLNGTGYGSTTFTYRAGASSNTTTGLVSTVTAGGTLYEYTYDEENRITAIRRAGTLYASYKYDAQGRISRAREKQADLTAGRAWGDPSLCRLKKTGFGWRPVFPAA